MGLALLLNHPDCADGVAQSDGHLTQSDGHRGTAGKVAELEAGEVKLLRELASQSPEGNNRVEF